MTYRTIAGDTFDLVAFKTLGSCQYTEILINANRQFLDYFIFPAGLTLTIPEITTQEQSVKLPPWKK